ncbi:hypothetical protein ACWOE5_06900 [Aerococcus sanguinicola]|uniref:DUF3784 domain-containing protein n=1 Tax=Aerococcus sanguinicola TaxID=119206 RepID=A0A0X8FAC6_9LACT|nr:hypothetical protein [Aerococcus sanguinicola]AMB93692.1 hypothetical protein AWM72_02460 [Aerococcus sanguinicola]MDK7050462.1 hypothetical protein [Aerococcus sanguinicola]PKZ21578.1 hypothetical protein CYJ28_06635 [Aerococcus sanguinicola]
MAEIGAITSVVMLGCGLVISWQAWQIAYKERLDLLNGYHPGRLAAKDRVRFARGVGQGLGLIGWSVALTGLSLLLSQSLWSWLVFGLGFVLGLGRVIWTNHRYHGLF